MKTTENIYESNLTLDEFLCRYFEKENFSQVLNSLVSDNYETLRSWADTNESVPYTVLDVIEECRDNIALIEDCFFDLKMVRVGNYALIV